MAFEAIVERHGPMVLRVCRTVLARRARGRGRVPGDVPGAGAAGADDRRARFGLGNWLYGVALRTARKARIAAARRVARDRRRGRPAAGGDRRAGGRRAGAELDRVLHEEIGRLPGTYRAAVVVCYLEGLTHGQAADQLGWRRAPSAAARPGAEAARPPADPPRASHRPSGSSRWRIAGRSGRRRPSSRRPRGCPMRSSGPWPATPSISRDPQARRRAAPSRRRRPLLADGVLSTMWLPSFKTVLLRRRRWPPSGSGSPPPRPPR